jgi:serine/threonine-protein kinase
VTLEALVGRSRVFDVDRVGKLLGYFCHALQAAHNAGIIHRDMKPENVFIVRKKGCLPLEKLLDFGMCRRNAPEKMDERTLTRVGTVVGTPEYMAPEQASGVRDFDHRIDLYAVGVILYELLTGTRAFFGADARAVLVSVLARQLPSVRALCPEVPVVLDRIVARAVERDPRARYFAAADLQHDLLHARTALRRQRAVRAQANAHQAGPAPARSEWELPTRQLTSRAAFRRPE